MSRAVWPPSDQAEFQKARKQLTTRPAPTRFASLKTFHGLCASSILPFKNAAVYHFRNIECSLLFLLRFFSVFLPACRPACLSASLVRHFLSPILPVHSITRRQKSGVSSTLLLMVMNLCSFFFYIVFLNFLIYFLWRRRLKARVVFHFMFFSLCYYDFVVVVLFCIIFSHDLLFCLS